MEPYSYAQVTVYLLTGFWIVVLVREIEVRTEKRKRERQEESRRDFERMRRKHLELEEHPNVRQAMAKAYHALEDHLLKQGKMK